MRRLTSRSDYNPVHRRQQRLSSEELFDCSKFENINSDHSLAIVTLNSVTYSAERPAGLMPFSAIQITKSFSGSEDRTCLSTPSLPSARVTSCFVPFEPSFIKYFEGGLNPIHYLFFFFLIRNI